MNKKTKWTVVSVENYDMGKVLEWLLNNGGGYNFWHGDTLAEGDTRGLCAYCREEYGIEERDTIYYLWLLNRNNVITLKGFDGDKGTEFEFYVDMNCLDGEYLDLKVVEEKN